MDPNTCLDRMASHYRNGEGEELEFLGITGQDGWEDILTPRGIAVREHLKDTTPHD